MSDEEIIKDFETLVKNCEPPIEYLEYGYWWRQKRAADLLRKQQKEIDKAIKYIEANTCDEEIYGNNDNGDYYQTIQCLSLRGGEIGKLLGILRGESNE